MTPSFTLVSLACAIAGSSPEVQPTLNAQLSTKEQAKVSAIVELGYCLPKNFEILIKNSTEAVRAGQIDMQERTQPTGGGF